MTHAQKDAYRAELIAAVRDVAARHEQACIGYQASGSDENVIAAFAKAINEPGHVANQDLYMQCKEWLEPTPMKVGFFIR